MRWRSRALPEWWHGQPYDCIQLGGYVAVAAGVGGRRHRARRRAEARLAAVEHERWWRRKFRCGHDDDIPF